MTDAPQPTAHPSAGGSEARTPSRLPLFAAIAITVLAWASAFVVIRGVAPHIGGGALALGRLVVGVVALAVLLAIGRRWVAPTAREWALLVLYGVAWFCGYNVALNLAESTLDAGTTALVVNVGPILIAAGGALVFHERIGRWLAIGFAVAFTGVVLISVGNGVRFGDAGGVLWALAAAVLYAVGVLSQKPTLRRLPGIQVTFLGCAIGAVASLPFAPALIAEASAAPTAAIAGVVYLGVVPTALAFTTWAYALGRMPASRLGVSTYVVPPVAVLLALAFFGEFPTPLAIAGGVLSLVGVGLSRRRSAAAPVDPDVDTAAEPGSPEASGAAPEASGAAGPAAASETGVPERAGDLPQ